MFLLDVCFIIPQPCGFLCQFSYLFFRNIILYFLRQWKRSIYICARIFISNICIDQKFNRTAITHTTNLV